MPQDVAGPRLRRALTPRWKQLLQRPAPASDQRHSSTIRHRCAAHDVYLQVQEQPLRAGGHRRRGKWTLFKDVEMVLCPLKGKITRWRMREARPQQAVASARWERGLGTSR